MGCHVTISDLCADLGTRQPVKPSHARRCVDCGAEDFIPADELESPGSPNGTGRGMLMCGVCGCPVEDDGTTETRWWVGL